MATEGVGDGRLANREKLVLSACPHDTAEDPEQWFLFTQMLSKVLGHSIRFELALDFPDFWSTMEQLDLVYANPNDSLTLVSIHGFLPLARFNGRFDEGVVVGREDSPFDLQEISSKRVSTCTSMLVTNTVVTHLKKMGLPLGQIVDAPSWGVALANLLKGEAEFAILYLDFFEQLKSASRKQLVVFTTSNEKSVFHSFLLAPRRAHLKERITEALLTLHQRPEGASMLRDFGCDALVPVTAAEVENFAKLGQE